MDNMDLPLSGLALCKQRLAGKGRNSNGDGVFFRELREHSGMKRDTSFVALWAGCEVVKACKKVGVTCGAAYVGSAAVHDLWESHVEVADGRASRVSARQNLILRRHRVAAQPAVT